MNGMEAIKEILRFHHLSSPAEHRDSSARGRGARIRNLRDTKRNSESFTTTEFRFSNPGFPSLARTRSPGMTKLICSTTAVFRRLAAPAQSGRETPNVAECVRARLSPLRFSIRRDV